jgi:feruloyl esterase
VIGMINQRVSTQDPDHFTYGIGFALNLPNTWHSRFEMMGGGGTDGSLQADPQGAAGVELGQGWVVAADDGGHENNATNVVGGYQDDDTNAGGSAHFAIGRAATTATMASRRPRRSRSRSSPPTTASIPSIPT